MTARVSQAGVFAAVKETAQPRLSQAAVMVLVTKTPESSPSQVDQAFLAVCVRRKDRRLVITTD